MCMQPDDLPEAGHCLSHSHPVNFVLLFLDSQSETWKHANPLTVWSISNNGPAHDKNRACKGCCWSSTLASIRTHRGHSCVCHLQQTWLGSPSELWELTIGNSLEFTSRIQDLLSFWGAECAPVSKEKLLMYFHGQESLEWVFGLDQPWLN